VAGIPLMFLAGWWVAGWSQRKPGIKAVLFLWLAYTTIDLAILLVVGITFRVAIILIISFATKLTAAYVGAWLRLRQQAEAGAAAGGGRM